MSVTKATDAAYAERLLKNTKPPLPLAATFVPYSRTQTQEVRQAMDKMFDESPPRVAFDFGNATDQTVWSIYKDGQLQGYATSQRRVAKMSVTKAKKQYEAALRKVRDANKKVARLELELSNARQDLNQAKLGLEVMRGRYEEQETLT